MNAFHLVVVVLTHSARSWSGFSRLPFSRGPAAGLTSLVDPVLPYALLCWTRQPGTETYSRMMRILELCVATVA